MDKDQYWLILSSRLRKLDKRAEYGVLFLVKFYKLRLRFEFLGLIPDNWLFWLCDRAAGVKF